MFNCTKYRKGISITEYIIPIAVVGLIAGLSLYNLSSNGNLEKFFMFSVDGTLDTNGTSIQVNKPDKYIPIKLNGGEFGGTTAQPVEYCINNMCKIDFGEFVLTGIPEDFEEFVKTQGSSGGSNVLANLLMQISKQLEKEGDLTGALDYKNMANIGHYLASVQEKMETSSESCISNADPTAYITCVNTKMNQNQSKCLITLATLSVVIWKQIIRLYLMIDIFL